MNIDFSNSSPPKLAERAANEAFTAQRAIQPQAMADNTKQVYALSDGANGGQQAEHIRGMVAITMAHMSLDANGVTSQNAMHWQSWALGLADRLDRAAAQPKEFSLQGKPGI